jgi:hypothetical protein
VLALTLYVPEPVAKLALATLLSEAATLLLKLATTLAEAARLAEGATLELTLYAPV